MTVAIGVVVVIALFVLIFLGASVRVLREYERGVIFRLGRLIARTLAPAMSRKPDPSSADARKRCRAVAEVHRFLAQELLARKQRHLEERPDINPRPARRSSDAARLSSQSA